MRVLSSVLVGAALAASPVGAWAAGQAAPALGMAPLCGPKVLVLQTAPGAGPVTVTVNPVSAAPACVDRDGDALRLTAAEGFTNGASGALVGENQVEVSNIGSGGTTFTYKVIDGRGLAVRAPFTIRRP
jgi:Big-like domain-containing protein